MPGTEKCLQIPLFQSLLLYPERDGVDWICGFNREVLSFVVANQRRKDFQFITFIGAWVSAHEPFDALKGLLIVSRGLDWANIQQVFSGSIRSYSA